MSEEMIELNISTNKCGTLRVYVQGNLEEKEGKTVFVTIHDIGVNHKSWMKFVEEDVMSDMRASSIFLHVCLPGQGENEAVLEGEFPPLNDIGEELYRVVDAAGVKTCLVMGDGAGANVACRFALSHPGRVVGMVLIHPSYAATGVLDVIKDKMTNWQLVDGSFSQTVVDYLLAYKFGTVTNYYCV